MDSGVICEGSSPCATEVELVGLMGSKRGEQLLVSMTLGISEINAC